MKQTSPPDKIAPVASGRAPAPGVAAPLLLSEISQFIYREAQLQDDHAYGAWEALCIRELHVGRCSTRQPRSRLRRAVSNIEITGVAGHEIAAAKVVLVNNDQALDTLSFLI